MAKSVSKEENRVDWSHFFDARPSSRYCLEEATGRVLGYSVQIKNDNPYHFLR
jgi:hypothetical protein